mgnify:CR=1 FL=1
MDTQPRSVRGGWNVDKGEERMRRRKMGGEEVCF